MGKKNTEWPKYMLNAKTGEGTIVPSEDKIPDGYVTRDEYEAQDAPAPAKDDSSNKGLAKANGLTKKAMVADFDAADIEYDPKAGVDDLAALYLSIDWEPAEDEDGGEEGEDE